MMKARKVLYTTMLVFLLSLMVFTTAFAASVSSGGITLQYPDYPLSGPGLQSCAPWEEPSANTITLDGLPAGATVTVTFVYSSPYTGSPVYQPPVVYSNVAGGTLVVPVVYPQDSANWPVFNASTNERAIAVAALVVVQHDGKTTKLISKQWWVRCVPPKDFQGCTPGYWRQPHHFDSWAATGFAPTDSFGAVFGVSPSFSPSTLADAVALGGGGEFALARHAVAGLLNAAHPDVNYFFTTAQVIAGVQNAYATGNFEPFKEELDFANNAGCPLN
jgi:hypothetical protein